jgi:hypothetical protein
MEGSVMRRLAEALGDVGFVIKRIEEEAYSHYNRPSSGEKYTGEIVIKVRPVKDEEADAEKVRAWEEGEKAGCEALTPLAAPVLEGGGVLSVSTKGGAARKERSAAFAPTGRRNMGAVAKAEFKRRWESGPDGGWIANDDCAGG